MFDLAMHVVAFVLAIPMVLLSASPFIFLVWAVIDANDKA